MSTSRLENLGKATTSSDGAVLERVAGGDVNALGVLYDRYAPGLLRFARRLEPAEAEDIVQTVFLRVVRLAATFDVQHVSARPWLFAITARVAQERRRALRRWAAAKLRLSEERSRTTPGISELRRDLELGLNRLAKPKRIVLLLSEVEGFSCPEIAQMLQIPVGTVWTRLHHARRELRASPLGDGE